MKRLSIPGLLLVVLCLLLLVSGCGIAKQQYTLTIAVEGDGTISPEPGSHMYDENAVVTLTATPAVGNVFDHWGGTDGASVTAANSIAMDGNKSIVAVFTKLSHSVNVTAAPADGGAVAVELVTSAGRNYEFGQTVRLTATPNAGYIFEGWSGDLNGTDNPQELLVDSEKNVTAAFGAVSMSIVTQPASGTAGQPIGGQPAVKVAAAGGTPVPNILVTVSEKDGLPFTGTKTAITGADGVATFSDLVFCEGSFTLVFSSDGLSSVTSTAFTVGLAGSGTEASPYLIHNLYGLNAVNSHLGSCFRLENDIDASATAVSGSPYNNGGKGWDPIGASSDTGFIGTFDGNGHAISRLYINRPTEDYVGLFSAIRSDIQSTTMKNLNLVDINITGRSSVGALLGAVLVAGEDTVAIQNCAATGIVSGAGSTIGGLMGCMGGTVQDCWSSIAVSAVSNSWYVGGLAGYAQNVTIANCYSIRDVQGGSQVGGLIGGAERATIVECYATGDVVGAGWSVGGFVGHAITSNIFSCYARGNVQGMGNVAGFDGSCQNATCLVRCYSTGAVQPSSPYAGFMVWTNYPTVVLDCFYDTESSGCGDSTDDTDDGQPLTTAEMQDASFLISRSWDFSTVWTISAGVNDGYPILRNTPAE